MVIGSIHHTNCRDSCPAEKDRSYVGDAGKEKAFESEDDGWVLNLNPLKLKGRPNTDQEISQGAYQTGKEAKRDGIEGEEQRGTKEESDLCRYERKPNGEKGTRLEVE